MAGTKLFPLPGRKDPRTLVPQFLAKGADRVPHTWDKRDATRHAAKRLTTIVPTLSLSAWLKSVGVIQADTVHVRGAVLQDQHGTRAFPALHIAWGTPWLNNFTLWDRAYNFLPQVGRDGQKLAMEAAKWSAQTEIGPWGANYGDSLMEEAGKHANAQGYSSIRLGLAEAIRCVIREQAMGKPIDTDVIDHGVTLVRLAISQATDMAFMTLEQKNVRAFYEFVTDNNIAPRLVDAATGHEEDLLDLVHASEREWRPPGFIKKAAMYDYADEGVERERELWLPPEFREQAKVTVEATDESNRRPPRNMSSEAIKTLEAQFETLAPAK